MIFGWHGFVESRMPGNGHVRFGGADRGNDIPKGMSRAPVRPLPPTGDNLLATQDLDSFMSDLTREFTSQLTLQLRGFFYAIAAFFLGVVGLVLIVLHLI